jgi:pimeloyl-ACP methyl ester carboxylesterase
MTPRSFVKSLALALVAACCALAAAGATPPTGHWTGTVGPAADVRQMAVTMTAAGDSVRAVLDLPESGLAAEPVILRAAGDSITWVLETGLGAVVFAGLRSGERIAGEMRLGPSTHPFTLARGGEAPPRAHEREVTFVNGDVRLAGTFLTPAGGGPWPAVVFVHGSGVQTRLGTGDRGRAEAYIRNGFAVLVYDKRGVGASTGDWRRVGFDELAGDALAGVDFLARQKGVRRDAIGLVGRSQGAWISEIAAARTPAVAFVVAEVGGGVTPWRQETYRVEAELRGRGAPDAQIAEAVAFTRLHYDVARGDSAWSVYEPRIAAARQAPWSDLRRPWTSAEQAHLVWKQMMSFEPAPILRTLRTPVLFALAEHDHLTPTAMTLEAVRAAAAANPAGRFDTIVFTNCNHDLLVWPESGIPREPEGYPGRVVEWAKKAVTAK